MSGFGAGGLERILRHNPLHEQERQILFQLREQSYEQVCI